MISRGNATWRLVLFFSCSKICKNLLPLSKTSAKGDLNRSQIFKLNFVQESDSIIEIFTSKDLSIISEMFNLYRIRVHMYSFCFQFTTNHFERCILVSFENERGPTE